MEAQPVVAASARACHICDFKGDSITDLNSHYRDKHQDAWRAQPNVAIVREALSVLAPFCMGCHIHLHLTGVNGFKCVQAACDRSRQEPTVFPYAVRPNYKGKTQVDHLRFRVERCVSTHLLILLYLTHHSYCRNSVCSDHA